MGIEKILNSPLEIGRKTISYIATDPAGEISLITGYKLMDDSPVLSIPFLLFGVLHIPYAIHIRKKLDREVKQNKGLSKKIIEKFNKSSWCSHRVTIAYAFGQGKYKEFKELLNRYPLKHYTKRLVQNIKKKINYFFSSLKNSE